jgi:hypothetical protein
MTPLIKKSNICEAGVKEIIPSLQLDYWLQATVTALMCFHLGTTNHGNK